MLGPILLSVVLSVHGASVRLIYVYWSINCAYLRSGSVPRKCFLKREWTVCLTLTIDRSVHGHTPQQQKPTWLLFTLISTPEKKKSCLRKYNQSLIWVRFSQKWSSTTQKSLFLFWHSVCKNAPNKITSYFNRYCGFRERCSLPNIYEANIGSSGKGFLKT